MHEWPPNRILVAVDFGEASGRACTTAAGLAAAAEASVTVLHAERVDAPAYFTHEQLDVIESELQAARGRAVEHTRAFAEAHGLHPTAVRIADTPPVEAVLHEADHSDLVVVGSHGRRGPSRWWIGSVSERVVRASPVPVLVVHALDRGGTAQDLLARILVLSSGHDPGLATSAITALAARAVQPADLHARGVGRTGVLSSVESRIEQATVDGCDAVALERATLVVVPLAAEPRDRKVHEVANALGADCPVPVLFFPTPRRT